MCSWRVGSKLQIKRPPGHRWHLSICPHLAPKIVSRRTQEIGVSWQYPGGDGGSSADIVVIQWNSHLHHLPPTCHVYMEERISS